MYKYFIFSFLVVLGVSEVFAQDRVIFPISTTYTPSDVVPVDINRGGAGSDLVQTSFSEGRSYECLIQAPSVLFSKQVHFLSTSVTDPDGAIVTATANGLSYPALAKIDGASGLSDAQHDKMRVSLIAQKSGVYSFSFEERAGTVGAAVEDVSCRETSLYGSYNRFFAQAAIVEIQNAASTVVPVQITIVDAGGNVVVDKQSVNAQGGTRTDVIFASLPANNYGQIIITHSAPFGVLSGYVAEYDTNADGSISLKRERALTVTPKTDSSTN